MVLNRFGNKKGRIYKGDCDPGGYITQKNIDIEKWYYHEEHEGF